MRKAECASCGGVRNCYIRGEHATSGDDEHMWWRTDWYILECAGCGSVFAQSVATDSESYDNFYGQTVRPGRR